MNKCEQYCRTIQRLCNKVLLPPEYQQVEYIQSSGTQYLNIGAAKNHQYFLVDFMQLNGVYTSQAAEYNLNGLLGYNGFAPDYKLWLSYTSPYVVKGSIGGHNIGVASISLATRYEVYYSPTKFTVDGVDYTSDTMGEITTNTNVYVCTVNASAQAGPAAWPSAVRLYHLKTSSIDLYPCVRLSDNKPGMYDIVNNSFYYNRGTGEFTVGPNI